MTVDKNEYTLNVQINKASKYATEKTLTQKFNIFLFLNKETLKIAHVIEKYD